MTIVDHFYPVTIRPDLTNLFALQAIFRCTVAVGRPFRRGTWGFALVEDFIDRPCFGSAGTSYPLPEEIIIMIVEKLGRA